MLGSARDILRTLGRLSTVERKRPPDVKSRSDLLLVCLFVRWRVEGGVEGVGSSRRGSGSESLGWL